MQLNIIFNDWNCILHSTVAKFLEMERTVFPRNLVHICIGSRYIKMDMTSYDICYLINLLYLLSEGVVEYCTARSQPVQIGRKRGMVAVRTQNRFQIVNNDQQDVRTMNLRKKHIQITAIFCVVWCFNFVYCIFKLTFLTLIVKGEGGKIHHAMQNLMSASVRPMRTLL